MQVGVISDTHDNVPAVDAAVAQFSARGVEAVIHAGDFVAPPVIPHLAGDWEVHAVRGNNDGEREGLLAAFSALDGGTLHGRVAELDVGGRRFAVVHGEDRPVIEGLARGDYDYVCHGHYHERELRTVGDTVVLNPGAQFLAVDAEHRTVATIDTDTPVGESAVEFHRVEP
ncbi:MAG: metallophosphoesterase [Natronomonas sp.]